ncbi:cysteine peptidase family C39 domain-containing protein [Erysipelothrix larvae]|uniref:cysteine peptidase family C39 domain-containing protein n=1 Tax=Erysipelothrix larvae TaxID=1514105 RepID=UPI001E4C2198|nr:cysteine peptidase family C39 domain-containing protein [Erysipelothrix larvae]
MKTDAHKTSVKGLVEGLEKLNMNVRAVRVDIKDITSDLTYPAIAGINSNKYGTIT